jgi:Ca-activated chloride channel homolog
MNAPIRTSFGLSCALLSVFVFTLHAQNHNSMNPPETVCVRAFVDDPLNRYIKGLKKEHFRIYEDKTMQTIASFSQQSVPMSLGLIWDVSRSRGGGKNYEVANTAVSMLLRSLNPEDECFLINFSESAQIQPVTSKMLPSDVQIDRSNKRIALFDAVYMGLDRVNQGRHDKKALIIVTDEEGPYGQHKASEILKYATESDVQVFGIIFLPGQSEFSLGNSVRIELGYTIRNIANITGANYYISNGSELDFLIDLIHAEMLTQYQLCYTPTNNKHDGTRRKIEIKLDPPRGYPKLTVHARQERYAPKN